jgi:hypothetical protein
MAVTAAASASFRHGITMASSHQGPAIAAGGRHIRAKVIKETCRMWRQLKDFRRDWGNWSQIEQVAITMAAVLSLIVIAFGFAHS